MDDLGMLKDLPAFKLIMKSIIRKQIQNLIEELAKHAEEETIILSANMSDGSITHLGSKSGKKFVKDNEELKSSFLSFCLKDQVPVNPVPAIPPPPPVPTSTSTSIPAPVQRPAAKTKRYEPYPVSLLYNNMTPSIRNKKIKVEIPYGPEENIASDSFIIEAEEMPHEEESNVSNIDISMNNSDAETKPVQVNDGNIELSTVDWIPGAKDGQAITFEDVETAGTSEGTETGTQTSAIDTKVSYVPTSGLKVERAQFKFIPLDQPLPPNLVRLDKEEEVCLPMDWLRKTLKRCKGRGASFTCKKIMDAFFEPDHLVNRTAKEFATNNHIMRAVKRAEPTYQSGASGIESPDPDSLSKLYSRIDQDQSETRKAAEINQPVWSDSNFDNKILTGQSETRKAADIKQPLWSETKFDNRILTGQSETRRATDSNQLFTETNFDQSGNSNRRVGGVYRQCPICSKAFNRADFLERHMRIHTGEKPFSCEICGKAFNVKSNMKTHVMRHMKRAEKYGNYKLTKT